MFFFFFILLLAEKRDVRQKKKKKKEETKNFFDFIKSCLKLFFVPQKSKFSCIYKSKRETTN